MTHVCIKELSGSQPYPQPWGFPTYPTKSTGQVILLSTTLVTSPFWPRFCCFGTGATSHPGKNKKERNTYPQPWVFPTYLTKSCFLHWSNAPPEENSGQANIINTHTQKEKQHPPKQNQNNKQTQKQLR